MKWCILRGGTFVGPETAQDDQIIQLRTGHVVVPCDGSNFLSLVHVTDIALAIVAALQSAPAGATFNIVAEPIRNGDYLDHLANVIGAQPPPRDLAKPCPPSYRCSNHAARTILGWAPTYSIWPTSPSAS